MSLPTASLRLLVVNDYEIVIQGLYSLLDDVEGFEFTRAVDATAADVVLFDPFANSDQWAVVAAMLNAGSRVVLFGWQLPSLQYLDFVEAGVLVFLSKTSSAIEIAAALHEVAGNDKPRIPTGTDLQTVGFWPGQIEGLSAREAEAISFLAQGLTNTEITVAMFVSINTVKTYLRIAYRTMGVNSRTQALLWAIDHGMGKRARLG